MKENVIHVQVDIWIFYNSTKSRASSLFSTIQITLHMFSLLNGQVFILAIFISCLWFYITVYLKSIIFLK